MIHVIVNSDAYYREWFIDDGMVEDFKQMWFDTLANINFLSFSSVQKENV